MKLSEKNWNCELPRSQILVSPLNYRPYTAICHSFLVSRDKRSAHGDDLISKSLILRLVRSRRHANSTRWQWNTSWMRPPNTICTMQADEFPVFSQTCLVASLRRKQGCAPPTRFGRPLQSLMLLKATSHIYIQYIHNGVWMAIRSDSSREFLCAQL